MARRMTAYCLLTVSFLASSFMPFDIFATAAEPEAKAPASEYWLGIICQPLKKAERTRLDIKGGLLVEEVVPQSPADEAGIIQGDILITMADQNLRKVNDLVDLIANSPDRKIALQIIRDGREESLRVTLAKRPAVIDFSKSKLPAKPVAGDSDAAKDKQLMEAAKVAIAKLESAKAEEDAEKSESPENAPKPQTAKVVENPPLGVEKPAKDPAVGTVRQAGIPWRVTPKSTDALPEGGREHVQMSFLRVEADATEPKPLAAAEPTKLLANQIQLLEKRVDEIDQKLDEILKLLKAEPTRSGKKKK